MSDANLGEDIDKELGAQDFVKAWSHRLKSVYDECAVDSGTGEVMHSGGAVNLAFGQGQQRSMVMNSRSKVPSGQQDKHMSGMERRDHSDSPARNSTSGPSSPSRKSQNGMNPAQSVTHRTSGDIDWRSELKGFYIGINLPEKLPFLDEILDANRGKEEAMLSHLMMKYKRVIPVGLASHLDTLQGFLDAQTESSFVMR